MVLEEYNCFDAEMYADELPVEQGVEFRDDQRSMLRFFLSYLIEAYDSSQSW